MSNGFLGKVYLLDSKRLEDRLYKYMYASARNCYSPDGAKKFWDEATEIFFQNDNLEENSPEKWKKEKDRIIKFCQNLIKNKHRTTLTHHYFSFSIEGASRSCVDQLVRSQVGTNFDVQSQRYVKYTSKKELLDSPWDVHLSNEEYQYSLNPETRSKVHQFLKLQKETYQALIDDGKPAEEARWVLSMDMPTSLMATYNLVSFKHLMDTRLHHKTGVAQSEICDLAGQMLNKFLAACPSFEELFSVP